MENTDALGLFLLLQATSARFLRLAWVWLPIKLLNMTIKDSECVPT